VVVSFSEVDENENESTDGRQLPRRNGLMRRQDPSRSKNESITFRVNSDSLTKLRKEADEKDISVNILVNQILRNYVSWHSVAAKAGFISIRRGFVKALIDKLSEEEVKMLAEQIARTSNRDFLIIKKQD
jgi:hypothetical protein